MQVDTRGSRQVAYLKRSQKARFYARILMPVAMVALSTGIWSDPVWGPKLATGVEEIKPIVASYLQQTPFADLIQPVDLKKPVEDAINEAGVRVEASLPNVIN